MSTISTDKKPLVDYGVQIRFIKDLHDTGGGYPDKSRANNSATTPSNKYGVAVRVQGISGQPYVVLKDGEKGDSYGVQLNTPTPSSGPPSPSKITNPYSPAINTTHLPVSAVEDEDGEIFGSPLKRPPGDGQAGTQGEDEGEPRKDHKAERVKAEPQVKATTGNLEKKRDWTRKEEYNEAGLKPVKINGVEPSGLKSAGLTKSLGRHKPPASTDGEPVPAVDTNSLTPVNKLISKFNNGTPASGPRTRGRPGARQRLRFDEHRRSRSLDARKDIPSEVSPPSPASPTVNPYAVPQSTSMLLMSSVPASSSLGRSPASVSKVTALEAPKSSFTLPGKLVEKDVAPVVAKKPVSTSNCGSRKTTESQPTLRLRERELTALKGALKDEVECHDREMEALREQYSQDMENLRRTMEQFTQSQDQIEHERERVNISIVALEEELESCKDQGDQWKTQLEDLQDSLLGLKKKQELQCCHDDLKRARDDLKKKKGELDEKREALQALEKTSVEKEAELLSEIRRLKEQSQKDKAELEKALEKAKEMVVDHGSSQELQEANARLRERLVRMTKLHSSASRSPGAEEAMEALEDDNRSLKSQLEEAKRGASRLSKERDDLTQRLAERDLEREALKRGKGDLEEQKRLLDRALEKINKEMELMMGDSRQSVTALQAQLDDYRERSRKDLQEAQRNNKDRLSELQRAQGILKAQQEEVSRLKKELLVCCEERDSAQLERDLLNNRFKHLESEVESERSSHTDRTREIRGLEDKIKTLEIELDEERSGVELLNDRITRNRDQVDQLRSELMQERSARHDLEMDKSALERQLKELKSRVADMEGQTRPSAGITLLENKVQELEEQLRSEEREKTSIQASQRRMERKLKELNATFDQERTQHIEQRDQLSLRVKALKRQVDESEGEVERLEGVRRKVLRDLEEQQELQEALHAKVSSLETELKRKSQQTHRIALGSSTLSSEEEDGFYDTNITSILNESHLQTSNC
uniref:Myosin tail domain-containing protein n=1 Tax=Mola mola TaxID=94237 RepID=A0A3Q3X1E0_MOLML